MENKPGELFKTRYKGYDKRSVDDFHFQTNIKLDEASKRIESLEQEISNLKAEYDKLQSEYTVLKDSIVAREKAADEISRVALKEANRITTTAQLNADSIVKEALATARQILIQMSNLGNEAIFLKKHVKERMNRLSKVIDEFTLPNIPSLDCLELVDENEEKDNN